MSENLHDYILHWIGNIMLEIHGQAAKKVVETFKDVDYGIIAFTDPV